MMIRGILKIINNPKLGMTLIIILISLNACTDFIADINLQDEWEVKTDGKIVLHYRPQNFSSSPSPSESDADEIVTNQNYYYQMICDSVKRSFTENALIYLYNRDEAKSIIGTNSGGHAIPKYNTYYYAFLNEPTDYTDIHGIENPFIGAHELVHVITHRTLGYPGTKLMSEGYAVWLDGGYARNSIEDIIIHYKNHSPDKIMTPDEMLSDDDISESIYYPNAGIFIRFIVGSFGIENANKLFTSRKENFKNDFMKLTGESWTEMNEKYEAFIESIK